MACLKWNRRNGFDTEGLLVIQWFFFFFFAPLALTSDFGKCMDDVGDLGSEQLYQGYVPLLSYHVQRRHSIIVFGPRDPPPSPAAAVLRPRARPEPPRAPPEPPRAATYFPVCP